MSSNKTCVNAYLRSAYFIKSDKEKSNDKACKR